MQRVVGGAVLGFALAAAWPLGGSATADPSGATVQRFRLRCAVALGPEGPVVPPAWLRDQVSAANRVFRDAGVGFVLARPASLAGRHLVVETRADRWALARYVRPRAIHCFVVGRMRDAEDPAQWRRGVHTRLPHRPDVHFVILSALGPRTTLAHELGHYFGNHEHTDVPGNIMSRDHGDAPRFDAEQLRVVRWVAHREVAKGLLRPMPRR
ncbi:MAG: hypothetical protein AAGH15_18070 [Myxococcota bacterium]